MTRGLRAVCGVAWTCALVVGGCAQQQSGESASGALPVVGRTLDAAKGRELFVAKGCVLCHAVNGVGGKAAPVLDAQVGESVVDPLDFAARMWFGAPAMIELQSVELGYTINLTADEIAHLAAFAADIGEQKKFTIEGVPEPMRDSFLDERFWEVENWEEFLREGQEGYGEPVAEPPEAAEPAEPETSDEP